MNVGRFGNKLKFVKGNASKVEWVLDYNELARIIGSRQIGYVFPMDMTDLFHKDIPRSFRDAFYGVMAICPNLTFQVLTKRSREMRDYLRDPDLPQRVAAAMRELHAELVSAGARGSGLARLIDGADTIASPKAWPLKNVWHGISAGVQKSVDERCKDLVNTPSASRFVSAEPLLQLITFKQWIVPGAANFQCQLCSGFQESARACKHCGAVSGYMCGSHYANKPSPGSFGGSRNYQAIDWIIIGGESGPGSRPMAPDWARAIRDECQAAGVAIFFKQWGSLVTEDQSPEDIVLPSSSKIYNGIPNTHFYRVSKQAAGALLDGRTWQEFPEVRLWQK